MNKAQRRSSSHVTQARHAPPPPATRKFPVIPVAIGAIVLLAVIAVAVVQLQGGSDGPTPGQTQPVTVTGNSLPRLGTSDDPAVGQTAPQLSGSDFAGDPVEIKNDGRGKVLVFMAHWCPHCQAEVPRIVDWLKANQVPQSVDIYGIATGTDDSSPNYPPSTWLEEVGWGKPVLADSAEDTAAGAMGLSAYPFFVVINKSGQVMFRESGEISMDEFQRLLTLAS